jgi:parallel beta-helix repeat protein
MTGGFVGILNLFSQNAIGTNVSGAVYDGVGGPWTVAGSPYVVTGDIFVPSGESLTIDPGVEVKFNGFYSIYVNGTLIAVGTDVDMITFTSNLGFPTMGDWDRIQIKSLGHAEIEYCEITYGYWGIHLYSTSNNNITNNNISFNERFGVISDHSSNNNIINNIITDTQTGISINASNNDYVKNNYVSYSSDDGIHVLLSTLCEIESNSIFNNAVGLSIHNSNNIFVKSNKIYLNTAEGIRCQGGDWIYITYNDVRDNLRSIRIFSDTNFRVHHNNFINSTLSQAYAENWGGNIWDDGYPSGGNYWSDYSGVDNFNGPNQDIPGSDGIGDTPYVFNINSQDNYPLMEPYFPKPLENYTILKQGWNLISIPLIQGNQDLVKVLEMIDGWYDAVQWYDNSDQNDPWKHNKIGKPIGNDLSELNETMGFWIHITQPGDTIFFYNGTQPTSNQTIPLHPGWNMVGYPSLSNRNRTAALNNIFFDQDVDAIWTFNATTQTWQEIGPSSNFELGKGYWIHSKVTKTWDVPL